MARFCEGCGHPIADQATFCDKCGRKVLPKAAVCRACGAALAQGELYCRKCGARTIAAAAPAPLPPSQKPAAFRQPPAAADAAPKQRKSGSGRLFLGLGLGAVIAFVVFLVLAGGTIAAILLVPDQTPSASANAGKDNPYTSNVELTPFPDDLKVDAGRVKVNCSYQSPEFIIPANYRSIDYVVFLQCWTDAGSTKLMVTTEIPGFTQKYEQMVEVSRAETELTIHPPLVENASKALNTSKDAQIVISVKDLNSGAVVLQESKPVKLYSFYDMQWEENDGTYLYENILAWVTPEAPEILKLLRDSDDSCNEITNGSLDAIIGYQKVGDWSAAEITANQVCAMMYTLADKYNVQYTNSSFSSTGSNLQRIATPANVINNSAGLCIETAVTLASSIQSTGMHAMVILLPGHAQVAVETWRNSGEYLLIETTALDAARAQKWDQVIASFPTREEWTKFLAEDGVVAIDCDLARQLNILPID